MSRSEELAGLQAHPDFAAAARRTCDSWAQPAGDPRLGQILKDVGIFMAALWTVQLEAEPEGLTHTSLARVMAAWGVASRGRIGPMLIYLQFRKMIAPAPSPDGRVQRYAPTPALRELLTNWFRLQLEACLPAWPATAAVLTVWNQPGMPERLIAAHGRFLLGSHLALLQAPNAPPTERRLDVFSHRRSGLAVLGQILVDASSEGGDFPAPGPVRLSDRSLARRADISRGQAQAILRAGEQAGFLLRDREGLTTLSPDLILQVRNFLPIYWMGLAWAAEQALEQPAAAVEMDIAGDLHPVVG
ncbi:hypothetical protein QO010_001889 [Caulobacter ginsengisoli]|uniref:HTH crp-type domain-containing protein n=1 Tax=Caulobacter ginsengisoli TaxID=400775 RepID=A0ABU0IQ31_9CAUL|nr:hypothetical protein [Caulobacter ginsengisoli]MDQ0464118.1 hypothetical protein [Caulobacter ginsengisoli]